MNLRGKRIAVCATRKAMDIAGEIRRLAGKPFIEDVVKIEHMPEEEVIDAILKAISLKPFFFLLTTGEGTERILEIAQKYKVFDDLKDLMQKGFVIARGYKTRKALIKNSFENFQVVNSTEEFIEILNMKQISGSKIFLQLYGEDLPWLEDFILGKGGGLIKVWVYKYIPDMERIDAFIEKILDGFYHAILFTSAFQVNYIFARAKETGLHRKLSEKMNKELKIVSVGQTTAKALFEKGVIKVAVPERERLSLALKELFRSFENE
ncbi:MAG: uroporphyrinogen-III synthase [Aquificaceae bacterium]